MLNYNNFINPACLNQYVVFLPKDDKSQYLALGGYTLGNWQQLERDLRQQILALEAWMVTDKETKFVTNMVQKKETLVQLR